jgi:hypothetical protein
VQVVRRDRRLWIIDVDGKPIYTPPNYVRLISRQQLSDLAAALQNNPYIDAVMAFEADASRGPHRLGWRPTR